MSGAPLAIASGGRMTISGGVALQNVLTNAGTVTVTGTGNMTLYNNSASYQGGIYNLAGALWDFQTNAGVYCACYGHEFFNNAGVLRKSQGPGAATVQVGFANTGTVSNLMGTLSFNAGGTLAGSYDTASGATTSFASGNFVMGVPPLITGSGMCQLIGGTLTLTQSTPPNLLLAGGSVVVGPAFQDNGGITNLTLSGAMLISTNTVTGAFIWDGGTLSGPFSIASGGTMIIGAGGALQNVLTNAGTVTVIGTGNITLYNNDATYQGGIYNLAGALWDIQTNAGVYCACYGHEFFNNDGILRKSQGSGAATVQVNFENAGTVSNLMGTLSFNAGGTLAGSYDTAPGATTSFASGSFVMGVPPLITGSGVCQFIGGTLTLTQSTPPNLLLVGGSLILGPAFQDNGGITNLALSGATLISTNTVTGAFTWNGGTIGGPFSVASGGTMTISGGVSLQNVLTNAGTVTVTGTGNVTLYNNNASYQGGVYNLAGALWDIQTNAGIYCACYGHEFFNNAGVLRKSEGPGSASIQVNFSNSGAVSNLMGTLSFNASGTVAGRYDTASGATTSFASGSFTMGVPPLITGGGLCELIGGTLTLNQSTPPNLLLAGGNVVTGPAFQNSGGITNLTLSGATLISTNIVTGGFICNGGTIGGPLTVASAGMMTISGGLALQNVLTNAGKVTVTGTGNVTLYNNNATYQGGVYNLAGALWDIQTNAGIYCACYGHEFFNNEGMVRKSLGTDNATIQVPFTNGGTVNALVGVLSFNSSFSTAGGTLAFGVSGLNSFGQINVPGNLAIDGAASVTWLNGFLPAVNDSFGVLSYGSHAGAFSNVAFPPGTLGQGNYGATLFSLLVTNVIPLTSLPLLSIEPVNANTVAVLWPAASGNFGLQTSSNLSPQIWTDIGTGIVTVGTNHVFTTSVSGKGAFFRLKSQ